MMPSAAERYGVPLWNVQIFSAVTFKIEFDLSKTRL
jgi:hypothetical protein